MPLFEMAFRDLDGGPVITGDAEIAVQRFQKLNLGGRDNVLSAAMRLKIDAFARGAQSGELRHTHALDLVAAEQIAGPPGGLGFVTAQNDLGRWRTCERHCAIAAVNGAKLRDILEAHDHGEAALASARHELFNLRLITEGG
jgi:hypothetical protein